MNRTNICRRKADTLKAKETHLFASFFAVLLSCVSAYITAVFFAQITKPLLATGFLVGSVFTLIKIFSARKVAELHYHRDQVMNRLSFESDTSADAARKRWRLGLIAYSIFMMAGVFVSLINSTAFLNNMTTNAKVDDRVIDAKISEKTRHLQGHREALERVSNGPNGSRALATQMASASTEEEIKALQARIGTTPDGDARERTRTAFARFLEGLQEKERAEVTSWNQKISTLESDLSNLRISKAGLDQVGWSAGVFGVGAIMMLVALIMEIAEVSLHFASMSYQREHKLVKDLKKVTEEDLEVYAGCEIVSAGPSFFNQKPTES